MKGIWPLEGPRPNTSAGGAFSFEGVLAMSAAVPQVANAFHVAPGKRGTAVDVRRKCVTGRKLGL